MSESFKQGEKAWFDFDGHVFEGVVHKDDDGTGLNVDVMVGTKMVIPVFRETLSRTPIDVEVPGEIADT